MGNRLVVIHHTASVVGQLNLFGGFGGQVYASKVAVDGRSGISPIANGGNQIARTLRKVATGEEAGIAGHPGIEVDQWDTIAVDLKFQLFSRYPRGITILAESRDHGIYLHNKFAAGNGNSATAATGVRITKFIAHQLEMADMHAVGANGGHR